MATNPIPKGSKNMTVNVTDSLHADLKKLAKASSMTVSQYVRHVLELARNQNLTIAPQYIINNDEPLLAAEDPSKKKGN